ncbi:hypothetical protein OG21DRAFT_849576 [Imleria badia]|nr:hypothetical protein OG21DRAFT_849576 [Imleria badia]
MRVLSFIPALLLAATSFVAAVPLTSGGAGVAASVQNFGTRTVDDAALAPYTGPLANATTYLQSLNNHHLRSPCCDLVDPRERGRNQSSTWCCSSQGLCRWFAIFVTGPLAVVLGPVLTLVTGTVNLLLVIVGGGPSGVAAPRAHV